MSHRRPDPRQAALENVLRNALRLAADSVEPAADGLDRIRARIAARQSVQRLPRWRPAAPLLVLWSLLERLEPAGLRPLLRRLGPAGLRPALRRLGPAGLRPLLRRLGPAGL